VEEAGIVAGLPLVPRGALEVICVGASREPEVGMSLNHPTCRAASLTVCSSLTLAVLLAPAVLAREGSRLDRVREEVREEKKASKRESHDSGDSSGSVVGGVLDVLIGEEAGEEAAKAVITVVTSPVWAPQEILEDDGVSPGYFLRRPYADGKVGSMAADPLETLVSAGGEVKTVAARALLEGGRDFAGVDRARGHFLVTSATRLGVQAGWTYIAEEIPGGVDSLSIVKARPFFRFAQHAKVQMRIGLGGQWMVDDAGTDSGLSLSYEADFFWQEPLVVSACLEAGGLGNASTSGWRVTAGAIVSSAEFYAGYDSATIGSVTFRGPVAGCRIWF
jgi:hypothetical protein